MTSTAPIPPITGTVAVPIEQAFGVFTGSVDVWWPREFHIGRAEVAEVLFTWHVTGSWQFDPEHASEINDAIPGGGGWTLLLAGYPAVVAARS